MTPDPLAFFTVDRGTATTAAALISPVAGRFRLLASAAQPTGLAVEPLLAQLVAEVVAADREALPEDTDWAALTRLETATRQPPRAVVAADDDRHLVALEVAVAGAGYRIVGRISPERTDALEATRLCLSQDYELLAIGSDDRDRPAQRRAIAVLRPSRVQRASRLDQRARSIRTR